MVPSMEHGVFHGFLFFVNREKCANSNPWKMVIFDPGNQP